MQTWHLLKIYFISLNYVYDVHTSAGVVDVKGIRSLGARITGGHEVFNMGAKLMTSERAVHALNYWATLQLRYEI